MATAELTGTGRGFVVAGFAFAAAAVWIVPIVTGLVGVAWGVVGVVRGDRLGRAVVAAAVGCAVVGVLLGQLPGWFYN